MKILNNREVRKEISISLIIAAPLAAAGYFVNIYCGVGIIICSICIIAVHFYFLRRRYQNISALAESIDEILHGNRELLISDSTEGELAILSSEIGKMTERLKEQTDMLLLEKTNLSDAIADIFHQIRTPLTALNINVEMLRDAELTYEQRLRIARTVSSQLGRIQWLVESLLKMARIDAGVVVFQPEETKLSALIGMALEPFKIPAEVKGIEMKVSASSEVINIDAKWTAEALGNLIKNAIEHTPAGGCISVQAEDNSLFTSVSISDTGEGFTKKDLPHIFERFYKGDNSSESSIGIGLALSRAIISAQNGTVKAANCPEGGARFTIQFYKTII